MTQGFWRNAEKEPDRPGVIEPDGSLVTMGELFARCNRLSRALSSLGLSRGDGVVVMLPNSAVFFETYLAAMQSGLYFTPVNTHLQAREVAYIAENARASAFIADASYAGAVGEVSTAHRFAIGGEVGGFRPYGELVDGVPDAPPDDRSAGTFMLYTGGTTGFPKGVRRPLPEADPDMMATMMGMMASVMLGVPSEPGAHLVTGPLYHSAPLAFGAVTSLNLGHAMVVLDRFTPSGTLDAIERHRVSSTHMVPTMFHRLLALPSERREAFDPSSLMSVIHGAAPCPVEVKRRMIEWWGPVLYEYYAGTEGGGTFVRPDEWLKKPGTVGTPLPGSEVKILDADGNACPTGEPGVVWMLNVGGDFEYFGDAEKTRAARDGQWFTLGDMGYLDDEGSLFLCDRQIDMIISGGVNIYPAEVEAALLEHPSVADAAVIGVPDEEWGEQVKAIVELHDGAAASEDELIAFCRDRIAHFKCPRSVGFSDELPRNEMGKLSKRVLREPYWAGRDRAI